jgi:GntR family transcriptional regulator
MPERSPPTIKRDIIYGLRAAYRGLLSGELREDDLLPSIRQLARDLKISVITTTRAYSDLEESGFIATVQGKGSYVLPQNKAVARENALVKIERALSEAIAAAKPAGVSKDEVAEMLEVLYKGEIL